MGTDIQSGSIDPSIRVGNEVVGADVIRSFLDRNDVSPFFAGFGDVLSAQTHSYHEIVELNSGGNILFAIRTGRFDHSGATDADVDTADLDTILFDSADLVSDYRSFAGSRGLVELPLSGPSRVAHFASGDKVYVIAETNTKIPSLSADFDPDATIPTPPVSAHS